MSLMLPVIAVKKKKKLQEICCFQIVSEDCVHEDLEHNLDVGGVCSCGEVRVDNLGWTGDLHKKQVLDVPGSSINILVWTWEGCKLQLFHVPYSSN